MYGTSSQGITALRNLVQQGLVVEDLTGLRIDVQDADLT